MIYTSSADGRGSGGDGGGGLICGAITIYV